MAEPIRVAFVALGCAKNLVDSEKMLAQLAEAGAVLTSEDTDADVVVINTCGFLAEARDEAYEEILHAINNKKMGYCRRVVVVGCLVQRDGTKLLEDFPEIDALVGVHNRDDVARAAMKPLAPRTKSRKVRNKPDLYLGDYHPFVAVDTARLRLTPPHYAYLRISEGCNQKCTFCTIPAIRGPMRCKPPEAVLAEARELIADGAVELNLIGQDTTSYGADIGYEPGLAGLLRELDAVPGVGWLRLLYAYPSVFSDAMIDAMAECEHVVPYVDIPLQHINDRVLRAMGRRVTRKQTEALLAKLRDRIPGVTIRTTLIAGFPRETKAEFKELLAFVREFGFDALGVFPYSPEPDTPAGRMAGQVPDEVREERMDALMAAQQDVVFARAKARIGEMLDVLTESEATAEGGQLARHAGQAPEVDGVTVLEGTAVAAGTFLRARCTGADGYDLQASAADGTLAPSSKSQSVPGQKRARNA
ncbi:MAG: 30S ribosomal protein S12 methylthiotransferase RimO [Phycisphaerae bacterium]|nr:30S ribosomal protein S12 methylthiotransferase RimO [Phycisphaerae bacterium]